VIVKSIPDSTTIEIDFAITSFNSLSLKNAYVGTGLMSLSFPNHGFNKIISIQNTSGMPSGQTTGNLISVQTQLSHNFTTGSMVRLNNTDCIPVLNSGFNITVTDTDKFNIPYTSPLSKNGTTGIIGYDENFYLYGGVDINGISGNLINSNMHTVRDIIDENNFTFYINNAISDASGKGGGSQLYINSLLHGFDSTQTNTKNNLLNRSINLQGENYAFLCCPQLNTMMNTGSVKDIFARISLDQSPGTMVFSFLSNPKNFDTVPLDKLNDLDFSIVNYDGSLYDFNDLDYSFTLQITEIIDINDSFNLSSRRGIVDN
jgi:hypothetical protein